MPKINRSRHIRQRRISAKGRPALGWSLWLIKPFLLFFLAVAIILLAFKSVSTFLYTNPVFRVSELEIQGTYSLDDSIKESIRAANIFKINLKELSRKIIARHPEILNAEVRRLFPNKIIIELKRRLPFARIESRGYSYKTFFVDKEGFVLTNIKPESFATLPEISGINSELTPIRPGEQLESIQLAKALSLLKEIALSRDAADYEVSRIDVTSYKNLSFFINKGIEIKIGAGNFKERLNLLERTLAGLKTNDYQPKYIDLRFGDPVIGTR